MPLIVWVLIGITVCSVAVAAYAMQLNRARRDLVLRLDGQPVAAAQTVTILRGESDGWVSRVGRFLRENTPTSWAEPGTASTQLVQAGFDGDFAPIFYTTIRVAVAVLLPLAAFTFAPQENPKLFMLGVLIAGAAGVVGPRAVLDRIATGRRDRIRRSIPDCLDLLVVCVEAGVGIDSAMLRVAREMGAMHPDLAAELLVVNRTMNAGITREDAMHGLWDRTGVEELRGLASSMIQSDRLGTSIARILRVYSETLRRKRKQNEEKRAAQASVKLIVPLALFMLPALFALVLGPAAFALAATMKGSSIQ